ncbi:hypothetical protein AB0L05_11560 [Nonomuraea pusilla]|uniref:hypothetical protein n=1 Tax=Nonomuraea pusilla TaxID=46177 RepID=UPI0033324FFA
MSREPPGRAGDRRPPGGAAQGRGPRLSGLLTDTADGNAAMRAVNDSLGYRPTHRELQYQLDL